MSKRTVKAFVRRGALRASVAGKRTWIYVEFAKLGNAAFPVTITYDDGEKPKRKGKRGGR